MRKQTVSISETNLIFTVAGQLYSQAPNRQPRKADIIMQKFRDAFRKIAVNCNEEYFLHIEHEKGISANDENRIYDMNASERWHNSSIDLEAFIQNVDRKISYIEEMN